MLFDLYRVPLDNVSEVLVDWYVCEGVFVDCRVLSLTSALIVVCGVNCKRDGTVH